MNAPLVKPIWHLYARNNVVYVPFVAQTEAGFFLDIEPVRIASATEAHTVSCILEEAISAGNPRIPTPTRLKFSPPVVLKYARLKTWRTFEKHSACFSIFRGPHEFEIAVTGRGDDGGWIDDPSQTARIPISAGVPEICARILAHLRNRADLNAQK